MTTSRRWRYHFALAVGDLPVCGPSSAEKPLHGPLVGGAGRERAARVRLAQRQPADQASVFATPIVANLP
jgi:hypothetical protein